MVESPPGDGLPVTGYRLLSVVLPCSLHKRCRHFPRFGEDFDGKFIQCANNAKTGGTVNTKTERGYKMVFIDQRSGPSLTEQNVAGMNMKFYKSQN